MRNEVEIFFCGDVMTGRGIDQIMPNPSSPELYESYIKDARAYVELAERVNGPIRRKVAPSYIWGEALIYMKKADFRIINLETTITTNDEALYKGINYRMHPKNIHCLKAANIDCCSLANNHILDWGAKGLSETIQSLKEQQILFAGAGENLRQAEAPAILDMPGKGRVLVFSCGMPSSGISSDWKATEDHSGVYLVEDLSESKALAIGANIRRYKQKGDLAILSIHWGKNWGYTISAQRRSFAHQLIDQGEVDVIHGHSSHHMIGIEVYKNKPILYGCGDLINDYEGISGHKEFKPQLGSLFFLRSDLNSGDMLSLHLVPTKISQFRLHLARKSNRSWLREMLNDQGEKLGTQVVELENRILSVEW